MHEPKLEQLEGLPDGLLSRPASRLHEILEGPTLIHLPGRRDEPLVVTVLLHGNEDTGWEAVRALLDQYAGHTLPRSLSLFIGNVAAARHGLRHLEGQPDFNRIWKGGDGPEHRLAAEVLDAVGRRRPFASIDVHNNTGLNPHYGCINRLDHRYLHLATLFSRTVVYFIRPDAVQSMAMARLCPAVTVECGKPGQSANTGHVLEYLDAVLNMAALPDHPVAPHDYDLFHTVATVKVPEDVSFSFRDASAQLLFEPDLDELNFRELPAGTTLAYANGAGARVEARNEKGDPVTEHFFTVIEGELRTRLPIMPSMLTLDDCVIRQDCLCYLMERLPPIAAPET
ncbi:M14 family metallopeptidase [Thiohalomonas denitrificans]|uniref:Succinylglutamate desuccinylase n=1 Tax=Thiohalomonas denitrificans TaxID=415747 RepID=A0A1G5Q9A9_9GAMM|nr:M14 family metallopeptidase [Thiohalomonas denitrificans]SCZ58242.1 Succinylglutamate desuccinylase [Thiohalomonas denitrificans]